MTEKPAIHLRDVHVQVEEGEILCIDELSIRHGERVAIVGNSGAGKTTLFRMLKGYVVPTAGKVEVLGVLLPLRDRSGIRAHHKKIGMIHQHFDLIGRETVWQNVYHGRLGHIPLYRSFLSMCTEKDQEACERAIQEVDLSDKLEREARSLSGGEQQRVAIARALAQEPDILLADEPVSSLDPVLAESILSLLVSISQTYRLTLLMNLHLPELAKLFAERIIAMKRGSVIWDGTPEELSPEKVHEIYGKAHFPGDRNGQHAAAEKRIFPWANGYQGDPMVVG
ncbi:MAG: ATP-binding cassette domain-containing protein [bacterium]|nr:ATP-binding cassette domain-containing protein [bacterium]